MESVANLHTDGTDMRVVLKSLCKLINTNQTENYKWLQSEKGFKKYMATIHGFSWIWQSHPRIRTLMWCKYSNIQCKVNPVKLVRLKLCFRNGSKYQLLRSQPVITLEIQKWESVIRVGTSLTERAVRCELRVKLKLKTDSHFKHLDADIQKCWSCVCECENRLFTELCSHRR